MCGAKVIYAKGLTDIKTADSPLAKLIEIDVIFKNFINHLLEGWKIPGSYYNMRE